MTIWAPLSLPSQDLSIRLEHLDDHPVLRDAEVTAVALDHQGALWFGTDSGLLMFDGYQLHGDSFPILAGKSVTGLVAQGHELWVGTDGWGIFRIELHAGTVQAYPARADGGSLGSSRITTLYNDSKDQLWVGCLERGLHRFVAPSNRFELVIPDITVTAMAEDAATSRLWFGTEAGKLFEHSQGNFAALPDLALKVAITAIAFDGQGEAETLWVATRSEGLIERQLTEERTVLHQADPSHPGALSSNDVRSLLIDSNRQLWIGTSVGLSVYESVHQRFINHEHEAGVRQSLVPGQIVTLFENQGVLWLGSDRGTLSRMPLGPRAFSHYVHSPGHLSDDSVKAGLVDKHGHLWIATSNGLNFRDTETQEWMVRGRPGDPAPVLSDHHFTSVTQTADGAIWAGTQGHGLNRLSPDFGAAQIFRHDPRVPDSLSHDTVTALLEDQRGVLWIGTKGGVSALTEPESRRFENYRASNGLASNQTTTLHEDDQGRLWIGSINGLAILDASRAQFLSLPTTTAQRLANAHIVSLAHTTSGDLWIGTRRRGLLVLSPSLEWQASHTNETCPLPSNAIYSMLEVSDSEWWLATGRGLTRFNPNANTFENFGVYDGLQGHRFHAGAAWKNPAGLLYFGGGKGYNTVLPSHLVSQRRVARPIFRFLEHNGETVHPGPDSILKRPLMFTPQVTIPYHESARVGLVYGTLGDTSSLKHHFRYRMEGLDKASWSVPTTERRVVFNSLPAGDYRLVVQSSPDGRHWDTNEASLRIRLLAPWHQRWWARIGMLVFGLVAVLWTSIQIFGRRTNKIQRQRELLELDTKRIEAALAKQLQGSMLLNRTAKEMRHTVNRQRILSATLEELTKHLQIDRSMLLLCDHEEDSDRLMFRMEATHTLTGTAIDEAQLPTSEMPFFKEVLQKDKAMAITNEYAFKALAQQWPRLKELTVQSMLVVRTSYLNKPNGLIILQQCTHARKWAEEEILLIDQVAAQVGTAIAQTDLQQREEQQRVELEAAKQHAEVANQAKSDFLAKITHELRTPLNAILGFCHLLVTDESTTPSQQDTLGIINSSGEHLLALINDVLDMSKIEADCLDLVHETFDLHLLSESLIGMFRFRAEEKHLTLKVELAPDLPKRVTTDVGKLRQTVINLVGNAIKFTDQGSITLRISANDLSKETCTLVFEVEDTGRGIAEDEVGGLFDKFFQAEAGRKSMQGTGLGLSISRKFIEFMGGSINVRSALGKGTVFHFELPNTEIEAQVPLKELRGASDPDTDATRKRFQGSDQYSDYRILIAEDQPANRLLLGTILKKAGFQVIEAIHGVEAINQWEEHRPHLTFMDLNMPELNGDEATITIRDRHPDEDPLIIALTASALEETRTLMLAAGCQSFLTKPFTADNVLDTVLHYLEIEEAMSAA